MTKIKPPRERDIEAYLVARVKAMGGEVRKVKWIGRNGAPDRVVMLPFRVVRTLRFHQDVESNLFTTIWVELKAPGEKPTPAQRREHKRMRAMNQRVEVLDSLKLVDAILR